MTLVVHCECGTDVSAETEDELVRNVEQHVDAEHPDMAGQLSRADILGMAHEH